METETLRASGTSLRPLFGHTGYGVLTHPNNSHLSQLRPGGPPPPGERDRSLGERQSPEDPRSLCPSPQTPPASAPHLFRPSPLPHGTSRSSSKMPTTPPPTAGMANVASDAGECPGAAVTVAWWHGSPMFWTAPLLLTIPASHSAPAHTPAAPSLPKSQLCQCSWVSARRPATAQAKLFQCVSLVA